MNKTFILLAISIVFCCCRSSGQTTNIFESEILKIKQVGNNVFMHISYLETNDFGKVACNGMVYFNEDEAIVFDTPTNDQTSKELIHWIEKERKKKVKAVVVTHFHTDCLGGLQQFHDNEAKSYANNTTIKLVKQNNLKVVPEYGFKNKMKIKIGAQNVHVKFFGEGHTIDNIVGYLPNEKVLFGGCLVKSAKAGKGNLEDANTNEWSKTVEKIKKQIPDLKIIIPGHGKPGGTELLDYTIQLFKKA
ncbi:subclass B1 metallo-beta-lactamase [Aquimarina algiphila]|uniref:beta-lactamase n=1 Tax=Aquimarina algiphila TaxID=2047982 RepID=A0A554VDL5_9FLAO|nr:subclass B1 metallo-beta-lactamase [Aquimarina algiphila]TSE04969.1 subclass B1 metallo-beta-lactamase [Aquimarina algiphila]